MALGSTFKRPNAPAASNAGKPASPAVKSRFAGIEMQEAKAPMPQPGTYLFEFVSHAEAESPKSHQWSLRCEVRVVEVGEENSPHAPGDVLFLMFPTTGGGAANGFKKIKAMVYNTLNLVNADDAEIAAKCDEVCKAETGLLIGKRVACNVRFGNPVLKDGVPTGDHWREYEWAPVTEGA